MRTAWLVCYDIRSPSRWRKVYKLLRGYGDHIQLSVFRCVLGRRELAELRKSLEERMSLAKDHVILIDMGPATGRGGRAMLSLGKPLPEAEESVKIL